MLSQADSSRTPNPGRQRRRLAAGCAIGLGAALVATAVAALPFARTIELKTYDWRLRRTADPAEARRDVVLVTIDETSLRHLEPVVGRWPWPRLVHAQVVNFLARGPARVVAYDVLFTERDRREFDVEGERWTGEESDAALADATRAAGTVVHTGNAVPEGDAPDAGAVPVADYGFRLDDTFEPRPWFTPPIPGIAGAASAVGHNFLVLDDDGPLRRHVPFIRSGSRWVPSLAVATVVRALGLRPDQVRADAEGLWIGDRRLPLQTYEIPVYGGPPRLGRRALISFPGAWSDGRPTYREYSFYDLFYAEQQILAGETPAVDPAGLRDAIVIVGATAPALHDLFTVPLAGRMPGPEVHAAVVDAVLSGRSLAPAPAGVSTLLVVVAGLATGLVAVFAGTWSAIGVALGGAVALVVALTWVFGQGTWVDLTSPVLSLGVATLAGVTYQYVVEGREKRQVKHLFSRYVSKDVYSELIADPAGARLGGQRREMSVLFSDIRGFTTVSEAGEPEDIVRQLNEYFSRMVPIVFAHRGTVDKFVGDMIMALFGAPLEDPDHADDAVETALAMVEALGELNREWAAEGRPALDIGIGINSGGMVAGNIGSESIMSYTVIGDNVNLGARLESLNKEYGTRIIVSEFTVAALRKPYNLRSLGRVTVKGKTRPVEIYAVDGRAGGLDSAGMPADK